MATPRQIARQARRDRRTLQKIQAVATAQTPEEVFAAELDLFRILVARLQEKERTQLLDDASAEIRRRRTVTFGELHNLTSPGASPARLRNPRPAQARLRA